MDSLGVHIGACDLTQSVTRSKKYKHDTHGPSVISMKLHLPCFAVPTYWARYNLSREDVICISEHVSAAVFWLIALLLDVNVSASAVRPSFSSAETVLVSSKAIAYRKIERVIQHTFSSVSVLEMGLASIDHVPALPVCRVSVKAMSFLKNILYPKLSSFRNNTVSSHFVHNCIPWLARSVEGDAVFAQRLIHLSDFNNSGKYHGSYSSRPLVVTLHGEPFVLAEEACLFKA